MEKNKSNPKKGFWLLTGFFGLIGLVSLGLVWGTPVDSGGTESTMNSNMGNSMGLMMRSELGNLALRDLFQTGEKRAMSGMMSMQGHHQGDPLKSKLHFATTATIFVLFPWIIGGLVLLVVLWQ